MSGSKCQICGSSNIRDYFRLQCNNLAALKCKDCDHVFIKNSPITSSNVSDYYTMEDFKGQRKLQSDQWYTDYYHDCLKDYQSYSNSSLVLKQFQEKLNYFNSQFPPKGRLLDVGCATGVFLDMAKKQGWEVEGVEISPDLVSYARENFSLKVHLADLTKHDLNCDPFRIISLFDVIEHLPDPNSMIAACKRLLLDSGILLIRTPTEEGLLRDIAKMIYRGSLNRFEFPMLWFYSFEHIQSFSLKSLTRLLKSHDFSVVKVFREEESIDRVNIPQYAKVMVRGINFLSFLLNKQHKMTIIAKKN